MPTHNSSRFPSPDPDPDANIVPADLIDDDDLWMLLNTYADGEATTEEVLFVESLLRTHPQVAREFSFLQLTADSVREFGEVDPPDALTGAIYSATARRKTLFQRVAGWWGHTAPSFGRVPLGVGTAVLASGILAVVLWSKFGAEQHFPHHAPAPAIVQQLPTPSRVTELAVGPAKPHAPIIQAHESAAPYYPVVVSSAAFAEGTTGATPEPVRNAMLKTIVPVRLVVETPRVLAESHRDDSARPKIDTQPANVVARNNVEERHMAVESDPSGKAGKPDELGADIDTATDAHNDEVAKAMPPVSSDEPPTTTVAAVSYRLGSIIDKSRNAPPAVPTLYMRTQEAIRRQHEMQQYGGYGKDAYNNIQRGEVGLSLVGGRF